MLTLRNATQITKPWSAQLEDFLAYALGNTIQAQMDSYNEVMRSRGTLSRIINGINSASTSKRVAGDGGRCLTNTLLKRRRGLALPNEDVRYRDDNNNELL